MSRFTYTFVFAGFAISTMILFTGSAFAATPASATAPASAAPAVAVAPAGAVVIGNFAGKIMQDPKYGPYILNQGRDFGWGWATSTDAMMGGHSVVSIALIHSNAGGSSNALQISGAIKPGFPEPWAGAFWYAGHQPMQAADLSSKKVLDFRAKGQAGDYSILLLSGSGYVPASASFTVTPQWKEYHISLAKSFPDADLTHVIYLGFSASRPGKFEFDVDQVSLH